MPWDHKNVKSFDAQRASPKLTPSAFRSGCYKRAIALLENEDSESIDRDPTAISLYRLLARARQKVAADAGEQPQVHPTADLTQRDKRTQKHSKQQEQRRVQQQRQREKSRLRQQGLAAQRQLKAEDRQQKLQALAEKQATVKEKQLEQQRHQDAQQTRQKGALKEVDLVLSAQQQCQEAQQQKAKAEQQLAKVSNPHLSCKLITQGSLSQLHLMQA